jgi:hypothetical protein
MLLIALLTNPASVRAAGGEFQKNWQPNDYRIACQTEIMRCAAKGR